MKIYKYQTQGMQRTHCNDVIRITENGNKIFAGVADGAGEKLYARKGAGISLAALDEYMAVRDSASFLTGHRGRHQVDILSKIRNELERTAGAEKGRMDDYASSLCAISADTKSGEFVSVNLGDGILLGGTGADAYRILSGPENYFTQFHTYLTTDDGAASHIRLGKGHLENFSFLMLMTDGIWKTIQCTPHLDEIVRLVNEKNTEKLNAFLDGIEFRDDASLILLFCDEKR